MFKLSRLADYAVVVAAELSKSRGSGLRTASDLSDATMIPEPTVAKVLKSLTKAGVVQSVRGAHGGYSMGRSPAEISVGEIVVAIDGPVVLTACVQGSTDHCDYRASCSVIGRWQKINEGIHEVFSRVTLEDMIVR